MLDIPTGKVTFLFTDIEGSTKLAQKFPVLYESKLQKHDAILKEAIESHGGFQFRKIGDAICAGFSNAEDAINAAIESQRKLSEESNGEFEMKVRMGIHTGEAEYQDGEYLGYITLTRASRVMAVAYGGQILLTQDTYDGVYRKVPDSVSFRDLGERRLKDLTHPERIHQIVSDGLQIDFPALKTLDARPNNLPVQLTSFIGREEEIKKIKNLLTHTHLLTLTGTGGVGKTRLALEIAADVIDEFPNGVWLAELAPLTDKSLMPTLFQSLGVKEEPKKTMEETLRDYLRDKEILIILDNCEHLIDASASLAEKLLSSCPKLKIIATSREALKCSGEYTHRVLSLATPDPKEKITPEELSQYESVKLFIERALTLNSNFHVNNDNAPALAEICYQLDGIPLAIELAAARTNLLSIEKINERLSDRFKLLSQGKRTAFPKQQTLRALVDWSYDLLSEKEKILFRRLTVFSRGWILDAAESVCADDEKIHPDEILDILSQLFDKSLIVYNETLERHHMLESIRKYGEEQLDTSGEKIKIKTNHFNYFFEIANISSISQSGILQKEWINRFETEYSNFQSALYFIIGEKKFNLAAQLAIMLGRYMEIRGYISEGKRWFDDILKWKDEVSPVERANVLQWAGTFEWIKGEFPRSIELYEESLAIRSQLGDKKGIAISLNNLGLVATAQDDFEKAVNLQEESLQLFNELSNKPLIADAMVNLGSALAKQGNYERAKYILDESLKVYKDLGDKRGMSMALNNLGTLVFFHSDYKTAQILFEECLELQRELGDKRGIALTLTNSGTMSGYLGDFKKAEPLIKESIVLHREMGDKAGLASSLNNLGFIKFNVGQYETALNYQRESLRIRILIGDNLGSLYSLIGIAEVLSIEYPDKASKLLGAMETSFYSLKQMLEEEIKSVYEKTVSLLNERLGAEIYTKYFDEGKAFSKEQAIELALGRE